MLAKLAPWVPRAEITFTALTILLSQVSAATGSFSHFDANALSVAAAAVFTFGEQVKDGWNKRQS